MRDVFLDVTLTICLSLSSSKNKHSLFLNHKKYFLPFGIIKYTTSSLSDDDDGAMEVETFL